MTQPDLSDMSLQALNVMRNALCELARAGTSLEAGGLSPRFDLTPGLPVTIMVSFGMPTFEPLDTSDVLDRIFAADLAPLPEPLPDAMADGDNAAPPWDGDAPAVAHAAPPPGLSEPDLPGVGLDAPVEAAPAPGAVGAGEVPPEPEMPAQPAPFDDGDDDDELADRVCPAPYAYLPEVHAAPAPDAPAPGLARAMAAVQVGMVWTEVEDARLVEMVVAAVREGQPKEHGIAQFASENGRTLGSVRLRASTRLLPRIKAVLDALPKVTKPAPPPRKPETAPVAEQSSAPDEAAGWEDPGGDAAARRGTLSAPPKPLSLEAHLSRVPRGLVWTVARDLHLVGLACEGWQMDMIAADMGLSAHDVKARFDVLTGYDPETKARRFTRTPVHEALQAMAGV